MTYILTGIEECVGMTAYNYIQATDLSSYLQVHVVTRMTYGDDFIHTLSLQMLDFFLNCCYLVFEDQPFGALLRDRKSSIR